MAQVTAEAQPQEGQDAQEGQTRGIEPPRRGGRRGRQLEALLDLAKKLNEPQKKAAEGWQGKVNAQGLKPGDTAVAVMKDTANNQLYYMPMRVTRIDTPLASLTKIVHSTPQLDEAQVTAQLTAGNVITADEAKGIKLLASTNSLYNRSKSFLESGFTTVAAPMVPVGILKIQNPKAAPGPGLPPAPAQAAELKIPTEFKWREQIAEVAKGQHAAIDAKRAPDENTVFVVSYTPKDGTAQNYYFTSKVTARAVGENTLAISAPPTDQPKLEDAAVATIAKALKVEPAEVTAVPKELQAAVNTYVGSGTFGAIPDGASIKPVALTTVAALTTAQQPDAPMVPPPPKTMLNARAIDNTLQIGVPQVALVYDETGYALRPFQIKLKRGGGSYQLEQTVPAVSEAVVKAFEEKYDLEGLPVVAPNNVFLGREGNTLRFGTKPEGVVEIQSLKEAAGPDKPAEHKPVGKAALMAALTRGASVSLVVQNGNSFAAIPVKVNFIRGAGDSFGIAKGTAPDADTLAAEAKRLGVKSLSAFNPTGDIMSIEGDGVRIGVTPYGKVVGILK